MIRHMQAIKKERPGSFECKICHLQFANEMYLESHMMIEHEKHMAPSGVH
ncbi:hypothetical protein NVIE_019980 [Nitrososphaera viennensis EN76]|uniref:C2H2-type domain-containing protein n=1 Tax=Nitrososphaera viennensis EN76 TaxID=926571 RepID=A0A060HM44_9ARCH|nr:hypothetical protein NVIE_019980 [Nitrososphaera viennensis EN76]